MTVQMTADLGDNGSRLQSQVRYLTEVSGFFGGEREVSSAPSVVGWDVKPVSASCGVQMTLLSLQVKENPFYTDTQYGDGQNSLGDR